MTLFYQKTLYNKELAPFFVVEVGDDINYKDWVEHIELLADFWLAHLLNEKTYGVNFVGTHVNIPLNSLTYRKSKYYCLSCYYS